MKDQPALPRIVSRQEWTVARKALLEKEKRLTREIDALAAERRRLPMVQVEKDYRFAGPSGELLLRDLFGQHRQLFVHHFMWNEETDTFCPGCTGSAHLVFNNRAFLDGLRDKDVQFVAVAKAPLPRIEAYKREQGWTFPWVSSAGSDFNYDYQATLDERRAPIEYNYRSKAELLAAGFPSDGLKGDWNGASVFLRDGNAVYHTYSMYARGYDRFMPTPMFLEVTPYGRQEDWEDSPAGWPQKPTYG